MKQNVVKWAQYRATEPNLTNKDIAEKLGISPYTLANTLYKARKEGWLEFADPLHALKYEMAPKVADNLNYWLDRRDKQVTLETAKATIFRQFAAEEGLQEQPTTILALKIELPDGYSGGELPKPKGMIVGKPNQFIDAEVVTAHTGQNHLPAGSDGIPRRETPEDL